MAGTKGRKGRSQGTRDTAPAAESAPLNIPSNLSGGGVLNTSMPNAPSIPPSFFSSTLSELEADVSGEMAEIAPTFGDVLLSVGTGIAESQEALDAGLVESAKLLSDTTITVVTDVIQELDDDGLPDPESTQLISHDVSLINYINPTVHEWKHMALSMDLNVGALDLDKGVTFTRTQSSSSRVSGFGGLGILGLFGGVSASSRSSNSGYESETEYEHQSEFSQGSVRMDAMLAPRRTGKFPVPAEVTRGPQIFFSQGASAETVDESDVVTERRVDMVIRVLKQNGDSNPTVNLQVEADGLGFSFVDDETFNGSETNSDGEIKISIVRPIINPRYARSRGWRITARLGQVERKTQITL